MNSNLSFTDNDYPGLYQSVDKEAARSQKIYFRSLQLFLYLLVLGAIFSLFAKSSMVCSFISAGVFLISLSLSAYIALKRDDRTWYSARAVAESVKTRTWRYMMHAEPFQEAVSDKEARSLFLSDLEEILKENREVTKELPNESAINVPISHRMEEVRALDMQARLEFYDRCRIEEQRNWYQERAAAARKKRTYWFIGIVVFNALAVVCVILQMAFAHLSRLPTEVFAVAAATAVSWLQAKRFSELSTSYALTAHEITIIQARVRMVSGEEELSQFVGDTENAFSREHTQWIARRDTIFRANR